jgi:hypothetical protein
MAENSKSIAARRSAPKALILLQALDDVTKPAPRGGEGPVGDADLTPREQEDGEGERQDDEGDGRAEPGDDAHGAEEEGRARRQLVDAGLAEARTEEAGDHVDVVHHARRDLPRQLAVVVLDAEPAQPLEDPPAQAVERGLVDLGRGDAEQERERADGEGHEEQPEGQQVGGPGVALPHVVGRLAEHELGEQADGGEAEQAQQGDEDAPALRPEHGRQRRRLVGRRHLLGQGGAVAGELDPADDRQQPRVVGGRRRQAGEHAHLRGLDLSGCGDVAVRAGGRQLDHGVGDGRRPGPAGDAEDRRRRGVAADRAQDLHLPRRVHRRQGVVEHEHARRGHQGTGQGEALTLPARQRHATIAERLVEAAAERLDHVGGAGRRHRLPQHLVGDAHLGVDGAGEGADRQVLAHRPGEEERLLGDEVHGLVHVGGVDRADVDAVEADVALARRQQAGGQRRHRRLARARPTGQHRHRRGMHREVEIGEHRRLAEAHAGSVELETRRALGKRRHRQVDVVGGDRQQLGDAAGAGLGQLPQRDQLVEVLRDVGALDEERVEDHELADADRAADHEAGAEEQQRRPHHDRGGAQQEVELGLEAHPGHHELVGLRRGLGHPGPLAFLAAEGLDDADAAHRLVDGRGHLGPLVEPEEGQPPQSGPDPVDEVAVDGEQRDDDHRQREVDDAQVDGVAEQHRDAGDQQRQDLQEQLQQLEVAERAGDDLAGGDAVEVTRVGLLQPVVQADPEVVLDLVLETGAHLQVGEEHGEVDDGQHEQPHDQGLERFGLGLDGPVDEPHRRLGDHQADARGEEAEDEVGDEPRPLPRPQQPPQDRAPEGAEPSPRS